MSPSDISALLGDDTPPRRRPIESEKQTVADLAKRDAAMRSAMAVPIPWLMKAFRMGRGKVQDLLRGVEPVGYHNNNAPYYDIAEAASHLVVPKNDLRTALKDLKPSDLPLKLQEGFWNAKLKEQRFREKAGDLWPTPSVMSVFGEAFKTIKSTVQLWTDTVEETAGVTDKQRAILINLSDALLDDLHKQLIRQAKRNVTESQIAESDDDET